MWCINRAQLRYFIAFTISGHTGSPFTGAVNRKYSGLFKRRWVKCASRMAHVVLKHMELKLSRARCWERLLQRLRQLFHIS